MKARAFYEARAKALIKDLRERRDVPYADLALKLQGYGITVSERVLINRINRGSFSFAFAMAVMDALGADILELPKPETLYPVGHRLGSALTRFDLKRRGTPAQSS